MNGRTGAERGVLKDIPCYGPQIRGSCGEPLLFTPCHPHPEGTQQIEKYIRINDLVSWTNSDEHISSVTSLDILMLRLAIPWRHRRFSSYLIGENEILFRQFLPKSRYYVEPTPERVLSRLLQY